jgi:hypothetical protein
VVVWLPRWWSGRGILSGRPGRVVGYATNRAGCRQWRTDLMHDDAVHEPAQPDREQDARRAQHLHHPAWWWVIAWLAEASVLGAVQDRVRVML